MRKLALALLAQALLAQPSATPPRFEFADIHTSGKTRNPAIATSAVRDGRYEIKAATMLDLIRIAWNFDAERVLGGPDWLEQDRFDVIAKVSADSTAESQRLMLQSLLADRFKLMLHEGTAPVPTWALASEKKLSLKEPDGSGETGCKQQAEIVAPEAGAPTRVAPVLIMHNSCRNMTMADFAGGLQSTTGMQLNGPVIDRTGLAGKWNFDVKWSVPTPGMGTANQIAPGDALEKQVGLKLEQVPVPKPVLVVDSVQRTPSPNPPGTDVALPDIAVPREFELADVKLLDPNAPKPRRRGFLMQPGGRFLAESVNMRSLLTRAFNVSNSEQLANIPGWVDSVEATITAKVPAEYPAGLSIDREITGQMLRALLTERFGLAWHTEQRMVSGYSLIAAKPKLKRSSAGSRIFCRNAPSSPYRAPGDQALTCQNATMALFAGQLQDIAGISAPVEDATGLDGGWDFSFVHNSFAAVNQASADAGGGYTIFESIEKQLGLRLKPEKRMLPVTVIDRLNQKPTGN